MKRFPGLDFLRFYAALSVLIYHITWETNAWFGDLPLAGWLNTFFLSGDDAVLLFFVLSGFLITSLLLHERHEYGTVDVRAFYRRRILRIFPLYYATVFIGFVVMSLLFPNKPGLPPSNPILAFALFAFLQDFARVAGVSTILSHLWSIGVEEQFYVLFPLLFRRLNLLYLIAFVCVICWGFMIVAANAQSAVLIALARNLRFDAIALGALGAWLVQRRSPILRVIFNPLMQIVVLITCLFMIVFDAQWAAGYNVLIVWIFMALIVNTAANPRPLFRVNGLRSLGNITYPLYMLHPFVIFTFRNVFHDKLPTTLYPIVMVLGVVGISFLLAFSSYRWLESPFLRLKAQSATVLAQSKIG